MDAPGSQQDQPGNDGAPIPSPLGKPHLLLYHQDFQAEIQPIEIASTSRHDSTNRTKLIR
jgi:hypothetical protein